MEIGKQIQQRRTAAGLSQEDLADRLYITRQTLSNWETGKTYPDINSLLRLSELFHISLDELVKGDIQAMEEKNQTGGHPKTPQGKKYSAHSSFGAYGAVPGGHVPVERNRRKAFVLLQHHRRTPLLSQFF